MEMMDRLNFTSQATARLRTNFAIHHLRAAVGGARQAYEVEQTNLTAEFGPWFDEMLVWVPVSVTMAGAALEAGANEAIQDVLDGFTGLPLTDAKTAMLKELKRQQSGNSVFRYRQLSLIFEKVPPHDKQWDNAELLVQFRNSFMHFKPSWDATNHDLVAKLKRILPIVPAYQKIITFPYAFMTYGCAKWAVDTVFKFSSEFTAGICIKDTFSQPHLDFALP